MLRCRSASNPQAEQQSWLNREVLRPVTLSVHVYSVRRESEADYGIGIAAAVAELFGTSAGLTVSPDLIAVIRPAQAVGDTLSATVRALSRAGTVSRVLSADISSLNGKPAQFFELYKEAYLREQRSTAGEGIAQSELVPGTVSSGFAVSYVPRITGPGEVRYLHLPKYIFTRNIPCLAHRFPRSSSPSEKLSPSNQSGSSQICASTAL